jgi:hypothetical protein
MPRLSPLTPSSTISKRRAGPPTANSAAVAARPNVWSATTRPPIVRAVRQSDRPLSVARFASAQHEKRPECNVKQAVTPKRYRRIIPHDVFTPWYTRHWADRIFWRVGVARLRRISSGEGIRPKQR